MKTKNIIAILAALPIVAGLTGCKSDEETEAKPAKEILIVEGGNAITLRSGDSIMSVPITADCAWTVESLESAEGGFDGMLSVQPKRGNGNGTLVILDELRGMIDNRGRLTGVITFQRHIAKTANHAAEDGQFEVLFF